jgi:hypothetical protein
MKDSFYLIERIPLSIHNRSFLEVVDIPQIVTLDL